MSILTDICPDIKLLSSAPAISVLSWLAAWHWREHINGIGGSGSCIETNSTDGVRYIVPQKINRDTDKDVSLYFRVGSVYRNAKIAVYCGDRLILSKKRPRMCPSEMETVVIKKDVIDSIPDGMKITVKVEE